MRLFRGLKEPYRPEQVVSPDGQRGVQRLTRSSCPPGSKRDRLRSRSVGRRDRDALGSIHVGSHLRELHADGLHGIGAEGSRSEGAPAATASAMALAAFAGSPGCEPADCAA